MNALPAESPPESAPRPLRVLVVDDDRDSVLTLSVLLSEEGYEVKNAYSSSAMWDALRGFEPDVVLLDITLPDRNGYEAARDLRKRYGEKLGLIAVTAWNKGSDRILAQLAGFNEHVGKPYDPKTLLGLLQPLANRIKGP